ncbi:cellobiose phosphorylase [Leptospira sp. WS39.C2]
MEFESYKSIHSGNLMYLLENKTGLKIQILSNLSIHSIYLDHILVNLYLGNELETSTANLTLHYESNSKSYTLPLFSPIDSPNITVSKTAIKISRNLQGLEVNTTLTLHPTQNCFRIHTEIFNHTEGTIKASILRTQDLGLSEIFAAKLNEAFVSQYIHHEIYDSPNEGYSILSRQNESVLGKNPACFSFSDKRVVSYATDGRDIFQNGNLIPFPNRRYQGEHSMVGLGTNTIPIAPNKFVDCNFYSYVFENLENIDMFPSYQSMIERCQFGWEKTDSKIQEGGPTYTSLFHKSKTLNGEFVSKENLKNLFPTPWRNIEMEKDGNILSFFTDQNTHITFQRKEILCHRPQGQILTTGNDDFPNESSLTATCYYNGLFLSQLTQGHASLNQLISRKSGDLGTSLSKGLRIFCKLNSEWKLLHNPSYLVSLPDCMEWVYHIQQKTIRVKIQSNSINSISFSISHTFDMELEVLFSISTGLDGENGDSSLPPNIEITNDSINVTPHKNSNLFQRLNGKGFRIESKKISSLLISDDRLLFENQISYNLPYLTIKTKLENELSFLIFGDLKTEFQATPSNISKSEFTITNTTLLDSAKELSCPSLLEMLDILPWYKQNARIHYLNPRGLEQFSGGGWGTRDVCQGAFEFLLSSGNFSAIRKLILRIFSEQDENGDWPQWFMLYERDKEIRANDSHGDILYWPILCVITYLERTNDFPILDEVTLQPINGQKRSILEGIHSTLHEINERFLPHTVLPKYGNGDWNDSMQPKESEFQSQAVSTWTAELQLILFQKLIWFYEKLGEEDKVNFYKTITNTLTNQIYSNCMEDNIITGLVKFSSTEERVLLLHPKDNISNIHFSILPMIYGILSNVFTLEESEFHLNLIKKHLTGPDGVRLFDKPVHYRKGHSTFFKRAETASFFGREIGLMYTHAHLRYCEALAYLGKSDEFFTQLNVTNPIGITKRIPSSKVRQSNCYYSSSDGVFLDRFDAETNYNQLIQGTIPLEGGWRVYSSGPGIFLRLFYESLLGIQIHFDGIVLDPILPIELDGLFFTFEVFSTQVNIHYHVKSKNGLIQSILSEGKEINVSRIPNPYRKGGLKVKKEDIICGSKGNIFTIEIQIE